MLAFEGSQYDSANMINVSSLVWLISDNFITAPLTSRQKIRVGLRAQELLRCGFPVSPPDPLSLLNLSGLLSAQTTPTKVPGLLINLSSQGPCFPYGSWGGQISQVTQGRSLSLSHV